MLADYSDDQIGPTADLLHIISFEKGDLCSALAASDDDSPTSWGAPRQCLSSDGVFGTLPCDLDFGHEGILT